MSGRLYTLLKSIINEIKDHTHKYLIATGDGNKKVTIGSSNTSCVHFMSNNSVPFYFNTNIIADGTVYPYTNNSFDLGTSSARWRNIYASTSLYTGNGSGVWGRNTSGTNIALISATTSDNIAIGTDQAQSIGDTNIYAGDYICFATNRRGSYKSGVLQIFREQSSSTRTIFRPKTNGGAYLGTASYRWNTAFFSNAITNSDLKEKNVLEDFDFKAEDFILNLKPIAFQRKKINSNTGNRIHLGFGAQDINDTIKKLKIGDLSIVQASIIDGDEEKPYYGEDIDDEKLSWGINYNELIAPIVLVIQKQQEKINMLEKQIKDLADSLAGGGIVFNNLLTHIFIARKAVIGV